MNTGYIALGLTILVMLFSANNVYNDECKYYKYKEQYILLHDHQTLTNVSNIDNDNIIKVNSYTHISYITNASNIIHNNNNTKKQKILVERIYCNNLTTKNYIYYVINLLCIISGIIFISVN